MKHITPQAQNYIFKERKNNKPLPFQESNGFITLDELKVLEKKRKNIMESDSDTDDVSNYEKTTTNDETIDETNTTDGKGTSFDGNEVSDEEYDENNDGEEDENFENEENEEIENEDIEEIENEDGIEYSKKSLTNPTTHKCSLKVKKNRTQKAKMEYDVVEDTW
jgi:hypothetical protein